MYTYLTLKNAYQLLSYACPAAYTWSAAYGVASAYVLPAMTYTFINAYPISIVYPYYASAYVWWFAYYYYA